MGGENVDASRERVDRPNFCAHVIDTRPGNPALFSRILSISRGAFVCSRHAFLGLVFSTWCFVCRPRHCRPCRSARRWRGGSRKQRACWWSRWRRSRHGAGAGRRAQEARPDKRPPGHPRHPERREATGDPDKSPGSARDFAEHLWLRDAHKPVQGRCLAVGFGPWAARGWQGLDHRHRGVYRGRELGAQPQQPDQCVAARLPVGGCR